MSILNKHLVNSVTKFMMSVWAFLTFIQTLIENFVLLFQGTDPEMFELILKVQFLQKRLLVQSSEAIKHNQKLRLTERLYLDLQKSFDRKPGPELMDKLNSVQKSLEIREKKLKVVLQLFNPQNICNILVFLLYFILSNLKYLT